MIWMSEKEICDMFAKSRDQQQQIKRLAELNDTTKDKIIEILDRHKVYESTKPVKKVGRAPAHPDEKYEELAKRGLSIGEAAEILGLTYSAVQYRAQRCGIKFERKIKGRPASTSR